MKMEQLETKNTSSFVTLTYNEENLPKDGTLVPEHLQMYLGRVRNHSLGKVRFFGVGEYGDRTWRPHYHLIFFGVPALHWEEYLIEKWNKGHVKVLEAEDASFDYVAGYTTKKMMAKDDDRLQGRYPEFARMSKFPPLGTGGFNRIKESLYTRQGCKLLAYKGDIPTSVKIGSKSFRIPDRVQKEWREEFGYADKDPRITYDDPRAYEVSYGQAKEWTNQREQDAIKKTHDKRYRRRKRNTL